MKKLCSFIDFQSLPSNRLKVYWTMDYMETKTNSRFSILQITDFLVETKGIDISRQAVQAALKTQKGGTNKNAEGYKLMDVGRKELKDYSVMNDNVSTTGDLEPDLKQIRKSGKLIIFNKKSAHSFDKFLRGLFKQAKKKVLIADSYVNENIIDNHLDCISTDVVIKVLYNEDRGTFIAKAKRFAICRKSKNLFNC